MIRELEILKRGMEEAPVNVARIIRDLGIQYSVEPMAPEQSGYIQHSGGQYRITVNSNESSQRQRFTAAHELAHYLLHRDMLAERGALSRHNDTLFDGIDNPYPPFRSSHEVEANRLAAEIIMPKDAVSAAYSRPADNVQEVADKFGVSRRAMEIRLKILGLRPDGR